MLAREVGNWDGVRHLCRLWLEQLDLEEARDAAVAAAAAASATVDKTGADALAADLTGCVQSVSASGPAHGAEARPHSPPPGGRGGRARSVFRSPPGAGRSESAAAPASAAAAARFQV